MVQIKPMYIHGILLYQTSFVYVQSFISRLHKTNNDLYFRIFEFSQKWSY
jgi:hypothetical protein